MNYKDNDICKCGHPFSKHDYEYGKFGKKLCSAIDCLCREFVLAPPIPKFVPKDCLLTQTQKESIENCLRAFAMQVLAHKWVIQDKDVEQCKDMIVKVIENG